MKSLIDLKDLGVLSVTGADAGLFLQGQTTCDVTEVVENKGISSTKSSLLPSRSLMPRARKFLHKTLGKSHLPFDLKGLALTSHEC